MDDVNLSITQQDLRTLLEWGSEFERTFGFDDNSQISLYSFLSLCYHRNEQVVIALDAKDGN